MERSEIVKLIRDVIREELAATYMGKIGQTVDQNRTSGRRFSSEGTIPNMRMIQPYGFASRPKKDVECVISPIGNNPTHLNVLGQFDSNRPQIDDGEAILYGPDGQVVWMENGGDIHIGSKAAAEPVVLGQKLLDFLISFVDHIITSPSPGFIPGPIPVTWDPTLILNLTTDKATYLTGAGPVPAAIVAKKIFVERGT